jgi:type I restriction enzyme R subunit
MHGRQRKARIKINKLLEESGWRFFDNADSKANVVLEPHVKLTKAKIDALGENFETTGKGFIDFLLLDEQDFPLVIAVKAEDKNPLAAKEQARKYAKSGTAASYPLQRQPALFLGLAARQSPHHPHATARTRSRAITDSAQPATPHRRTGGQGLHRLTQM